MAELGGNMTGFNSPFAYRTFANAIKEGPRFVQTAEVKAFLEAVSRVDGTRKIKFPSGTPFWRAQIGHSLVRRSDESGGPREEETPHGRERMVPKPRIVSEGRINPRGVAYLYLASDKKTAISEVRPSVGMNVTVAEFRTRRELTIVDLSLATRHKGPSITGLLSWASAIARDGPLSQEKINQSVWANIDRAFAQPVDPSDEHLSYIPTQVIAESLLAIGFDGVVYRSGLNPDGYNLALFDVKSAEFVAARLFSVDRVEYESSERGNWWVSGMPTPPSVRGAADIG